MEIAILILYLILGTRIFVDEREKRKGKRSLACKTLDSKEEIGKSKEQRVKSSKAKSLDNGFQIYKPPVKKPEWLVKINENDKTD